MNLAINELAGTDELIKDKFYQLLNRNADSELSWYFGFNGHGGQRHSQDRFFYCTDSDLNELLGLVHFTVSDESVFLNKVIIKDTCHFQNIASLILGKALSAVVDKEDNGLKALNLEVFEKNKKALNWYLSLGMEISGYHYWYDITNYCARDIGRDSWSAPDNYFSPFFRVLPVKNGLKQLYYNKSYIGSLVNDAHLLIRAELDYPLLKKLTLFFKKSSLTSVYLISKKELELFLIDKSFHLTIPLNDLSLLKASV